MFGFIKKIIILILSTPLVSGYCLLLKNQECSARKTVIDNDYMTFPYKIKVDKCIGSCNVLTTLISKFVYQILLKISV